MKNKKSKINNLLITLILIWLVLWLALVSPNGAPALTLIPFVLIFVLLYKLLRWIAVRVGNNSITGRSIVVSIFTSLLLVIALVLSSLGQIGGKDIGVLIALSVVGYLYIFKFMTRREGI